MLNKQKNDNFKMRTFQEEKPILEDAIVGLQNLYLNFNSCSKSRVRDSIMKIFNISCWNATGKEILSILVSDLSDLLNKLFNISNKKYLQKRIMIQEDVLIIINKFSKFIGLEETKPIKEPSSDIILSKDEALGKKPAVCPNCNSTIINYWDETEQEIIFRCEECGGFIPIPFNLSRLHFYFFF